jgi:hypothetical protein
MLVTLSLVSKSEKVSIDKLWEGINSKEWQVVKIHEIENIVLSETGK